MSAPVERAAEGEPKMLCDHRCILRDGHDGLHQYGYHLPAATVDGDLREALIAQHGKSPTELAEIYDANEGYGPEPIGFEIDALLPIIAAHVRAEKAKAWDGGLDGWQDRVPINPYRETRDE